MKDQASSSKNLTADWILNHLGENRESYFGAVAPPIFLTSNFCFPNLEEMRQALANESTEPFYTRGTNPSLSMLEEKVAALECGEAALLFASGSAAIAAAIGSCVSMGDHVICIEKPYSWTSKLLSTWLGKFGVHVDFVDGSLESVERAIRPDTKVLYLETPNSMTFEVQDIAELCRLVQPKGIQIIVDNSYATPIFQKPIQLGADIVVHSATKYFSGHSDTVGGLLICKKEKREQIFAAEYMTLGGTMSPMNAWLILRGMRTLSIRLNKSQENGIAVANWLSNHPKVKTVHHPFLSSNPEFKIAQKQMTGAGGLLSFELNTNDILKVEKFCNHLKYFLLACSWGGYESLCFPAAALVQSANYQNSTRPIGLIRIYCGLEEVDSLIDDLESAIIFSEI